jgi:hypothetical protein
MIRALFITLLFGHGLIHSVGFVNLFQKLLKGQPIVELSQPTGRVVGVLWLCACLLFIAGAVLLLLHNQAFWWVLAIAVLFSQSLVIGYWQDARFGTIPNVLILVVVIFAAFDTKFNGMARREATALISDAAAATIEVSPAKVDELPSPVRQWLLYSNVVGKSSPTIIKLEQTGSMRTTANGRWMPFHATQSITVNPPGFVWNARIQAAPALFLAGRDKFEGGKGNMLIKFLSAVTIANSSGTRIDESTMVRYLAELVWYPQAAVSDYIHWEAIDATHARATIQYEGVTASGTFEFADNGQIRSFEAPRYGDFAGELRKESWHVDISGYKIIHGAPVATSSEVTWKFTDRDFTWLKLEVVALE